MDRIGFRSGSGPRTVAVIAVLIIVATVANGLADELYTEDGKVYYGKVTVHGDKISIKLESGHVRTFPKSYVQNWMRGDSRKQEAAEAARARAKAEKAAPKTPSAAPAQESEAPAPKSETAQQNPEWVDKLIAMPPSVKLLFVGVVIAVLVIVLKKSF